jgi:hypothetical protein
VTTSLARTYRSLHIVVTVGALALAMLATAGAATAVENGTVGIRPSNEPDFFHLSLLPGAATDVAAIVSNSTDQPVTLLTYPVDGQSSPQGPFSFASKTDATTGVGAWVRLDTAQITVPAKSELKVPFRLSVPANTPPGDYSGGVIIQSPPVEGETSIVGGDTAVRVDVIQRQGVRIYLNVAGAALKSLELGELSWRQTADGVIFTLPLRNTGNTILHPTGTVDLGSWVGPNIELDFDPPESILPGERFDLQARQDRVPPIQAGTATAIISSEAGTGQAQTNVIYAPWLLLGIGLLLLVVVIYGATRAARFVRRARSAIAQVARVGPSEEAPTHAVLSDGHPRHRRDV